MTTPLDLGALLGLDDTASEDPLVLFDRHVNASLAKVLRTLGFDIPYVRGLGAYLWDRAGHRYIDCIGGYATLNVGRNHPVVRDALKQAMDLELPNLVKMGVPAASGLLARELIRIAPPGLDNVFFTNCGTEGVETAIKYARVATGRDRILFARKAFHGLTTGSLALNGGEEFREGFGTLLPHTMAVPFNDLDALDNALRAGDVAGFVVEPIQGKGVNVPDDEYLPRASELCRAHGALFIADEVQTGFGRTGRMFACEHWAVEPDIMVTAKGLSGGLVPVGAVLSRRWIHDKVFSRLDRCMVHSSTFGGNDLAMVAGLAALHVLREERLVENAAEVGEHLGQRLSAMTGRYEMVKAVRGKGLMLAMEFSAPRSVTLSMGWKMLHAADQSLFCQAILMPLLGRHRILAQVAGHGLDVIKLTPPLVLSKQDADEIADALEEVIAACHRFPGPVWSAGKGLLSAALQTRRAADREQRPAPLAS